MNTRFKFILLFFFFLNNTFLLFSKSKPLSEEDVEALKYGVWLVDHGKTDSSIIVLENLAYKYPKNYIINYEYCYSIYTKGDYASVIKNLKRIEKSPEKDERFYQLKGNAYDYMGLKKKSIMTYQEGINKFPNSGFLYMEKGTVFMSQENYERALQCFEEGINVAPMYATNYYKAAHIYLNSSEPIWGFLYGEMLKLLEPNSSRGESICKDIISTLNNCIKYENDTSLKVSLTQKHTIYLSKNPTEEQLLNLIPFKMYYELSTTKSITQRSPSYYKNNRLSFNDICQLRKEICESLYDIPTYTNGLFKFQKEIIDAGYWELYNLFLFGSSFPTEYNEYMNDENNQNKITLFNTRFNSNANFPNPDEPVSRYKYMRK